MGLIDLFLEIVGAIALLVTVAVLGEKYGAATAVSGFMSNKAAPKSGVV